MRKAFLLLLFVPLLFSCGDRLQDPPKPDPVVFEASLSVADSVDDSGNYSGFGLLIYKRDNPQDAADTLFFSRTDSTGILSGVIDLESTGSFPVQVTRNGVNVGAFRLLLGDNDTVKVNAVFPDYENSLTIDSREERAMRIFRNVDRGFNRTMAFARAGQLADSLLPGEVQKWADLYWEVFTEQSGTFAAKFALEQAVVLYQQIDQETMFSKLNSAFEDDMAYGLAFTLGKEYVADSEGFDATVSYLDSVKNLTRIRDIHKAAEQAVIKLHLDSAKVEKGRELLANYEEKFLDNEEELPFWFKNMRFELNELAPGMDVPNFEFTTVDERLVNQDSLLGSPYILEFALVANPLYQQQYDEAGVLYQIFESQGLEYFTIAYDPANTIIGFFEERNRYWGLADPESFEQGRLLERFNIQYYPSRVLVDQQGKIVRKFVGEEFDDLIPAINAILNPNPNS